MSYEQDMALRLHEMANRPQPAGYYIGPVVSLEPLTIALLGGEIMAKGKLLRVSETVQRLMQPLPDCVFNGCQCGGNCEHACFPKPLQVGDEMICIGQKTFLALDRMGG